MRANPKKIIGFRVTPERDADIVAWWESIPNGERSHILRSLIRAYLSGEFVLTPEGETPTEFSRNVQLAQLQAEAIWIKNMLSSLPEYLEHLVGGLQRAGVAPPTEAASASPETPLTPHGAANRAERITQRGW